MLPTQMRRERERLYNAVAASSSGRLPYLNNEVIIIPETTYENYQKYRLILTNILLNFDSELMQFRNREILILYRVFTLKFYRCKANL